MAAPRSLVVDTARLARDEEKILDLSDSYSTDSPSAKRFKEGKFPLSRWEFAAAIGVFVVCLTGLFCIYLTMPAADYGKLKLPRNISDLRMLNHEFKQNHGEWINSVKPTLDPVITAELHGGLEMAAIDIENCHAVRNEMRSALSDLLKDDGILVIPTVADPPPKFGSREIQLHDYQIRACSLSSVASLSGCCQVSVPLGSYDKCPISVSLIARNGGDRLLLDVIQTLYATLQEQADITAKSKSSTKAISSETSAEMAKEKGNQAYKEKQWQRAIGFYTEAIKLNGNNATYFSNRAAAYLEIGGLIQAEADCTKAIDLDNKNVKAYLRRGTAREMIGYYKEAIEDFRHALVLEPNNKRAAQSADRLKKLFLSS